MITIDKLSMDFRMSRLSFAQELYSSWDSFCRYAVEEVIDETLSPFNRQEEVIEIEAMTIDVGVLAEDDFYEKFPRLFQKELYEQFRKLLLRANSEERGLVRIRPLYSSQLETFIFFLKNGYILSDAPTGFHRPELLFNELITKAPESLFSALRQEWHQDHFKRRLIEQFREEELIRIVAIKEPEQAQFVGSFITQTYFFNPTVPDNLPTSSVSRPILWIATLSFLFFPAKSYFSRKDYLRYTLQQLAAHYNVLYLDALLLLSACYAQMKDNAMVASIYALLGELIINETIHSASHKTHYKEELSGRINSQGEKEIEKEIEKGVEKGVERVVEKEKEKEKEKENEKSKPKKSIEANTSTDLRPFIFAYKQLIERIKEDPIPLSLDYIREIWMLTTTRQSTISYLAFISGLHQYLLNMPTNSLIRSLLSLLQKEQVKVKKEEEEERKKEKRETFSSKSRKDTPEINQKIDSERSFNFQDETPRVAIENAGLVLLSPYFPKLFRALKLTDEESMMDSSASIKAIFLLQELLGDERTEYAEQELLLNRLLTGYTDPTQPLPLSVPLSDKEKSLCASLLEGSKNNWPKMKNTSIAGFCEAFLRRNGILERKNNHWLLTIENKAFDVLLDTLPWSYTPVKYPWMEEILHIHWR